MYLLNNVIPQYFGMVVIVKHSNDDSIVFIVFALFFRLFVNHTEGPEGHMSVHKIFASLPPTTKACSVGSLYLGLVLNVPNVYKVKLIWIIRESIKTYFFRFVDGCRVISI